jgi:hypothetical protein
MRRDAELIRLLLLHIETLAYPNQYMTFHFDGHDASAIVYHIDILKESGLIQAEENRYSCFDEWSNVRLTWIGHEFTALLHEEQHWQAALAAVRAACGGEVNFALLQARLLQDCAPS